MAVPSAYLTSTKNTAKIFDSIQKAAVPTQGFTYEFLKQLGYSSSSDRPTIPVLKAIGFLDSSGKPTDLYRTYKDPALARRALAQGLRAGYADVFAIDTEAYDRTQSELTGMFSRLSDKGESVTSKMAMTFHGLATLADFSQETGESPEDHNEEDGRFENPSGNGDTHAEGDKLSKNDGQGGDARSRTGATQGGATFSLRHDIHVHLPLSTDVAVYDAIFRSLRENLV